MSLIEGHRRQGTARRRAAGAVLGAAGALALWATPAAAAPQFDPATSVQMATSPSAVIVDDLNGDGDADAAVADGDASAVQLSLGDGLGSLGVPTSIAVGFSPRDLTAADLDGDSDTDLVTANAATDSVTVLLNDGSGVFTRDDVEVGMFAQQRIVAGNLTGSAAKDLLVTGAGDEAKVLPGDGLGGFAAPVSLTVAVGSAPQGVAIADFTADGRNDALVVNTGTNNFRVTPATAAGGFGTYQDYTTGGQDPAIAAVSDFNDDGRSDVAVTNSNTGSNSVGVRLGQAGGGFATATALSTGGSSPSHVVAADFDLDGDRELAAANLNSDTVGVLDGNGDGSFATALPFAVGNAPNGIATGDLDNDGDADMVVTDLGDGTVSILLNQHFASPDTTDPVLSVPGTITRTANGPGGETVNYSATATDNRDPSPDVSCSPASGTNFAIGTTTVDCTATDNAGNSVADSFDVVVNADTTDPVLNVPGTITRTANGPGGQVVNYSVTATDNRDPSPDLDCSPPTGDTFPIGTTQVDCTATDASGNSAADSFNVVVNADTTDPVLDLPDPISVDADGPGGETINYSATATDNRDPSPDVSCSPASGTNFAIGTTTVDCTATDASGNQAIGSFDVLVNGDTTDPVLNLPATITRTASDPGGKAVNYTVTASDDRDPNPDVSCSPPSGHTFPVGTTQVDCTATDNFGNVGADSFDVVVTGDTTDPVLDLPGPISVDALVPSGKQVSYSASASDNRDPNPQVECSPASGANFPVGTTPVECTATDNFGNVAEDSFDVTVTPDTTNPTLSLPSPIATDSWSPAGRRVTYGFSATDDRDSSPTRSCSPASGATFAIGVRTVNCTATDNFGNVASGSFRVTVRDTGAKITELIGTVKGLQVSRTLKRTLLQKLQGARSDYIAGAKAGACADLGGFIAKVSQQSGRTIPRAKARSLINSANRIKTQLAC